ncbi:DUF4123 domain-containing protein [Massilia sp. Dwa41.01b]|uniref:DUF4123 domain-containing protein n=1 Tax=unclassified Massilia TaxID=2609279 RepID=UPI001601A82E|nr:MULTISPECIES: DUF4123 domain-containing protein [unclassified Massilia]QNA90180.1 DUF4123 domain-containing protein [Massilia sp. Dwa41.01b]QNB01072.1 DUF4123 domain-containing protein [Massilia sp. Se16.2.3]
MKNSIYHSVDEVPVVRSVDEIIKTITGMPQLNWAALIDTAFDYGQHTTGLNFRPAINCYDFPELEGLKAAAPCLYALSSGDDLRAKITGLIRHCQGRPMLSFIGATESLDEINTRWRAMHMVSVIDAHEMLLRFADTRVLSYLPHVLTPYQWATFCGPVSVWMYFDRSGRSVTCDIPELHYGQEKASIKKEQLEEFLDASHPDALMNLIAESMCDILPPHSLASERYRMIKGACELAKRCKVNDGADVLALAVAAYLTAGRSNFDKKLELLLQERAWPTKSLGDAIVDAGIV